MLEKIRTAIDIEKKIEQLSSVEWKGEELYDCIQVSDIESSSPLEHILKSKKESGDFMFESFKPESNVLLNIGHNGTFVPKNELIAHSQNGLECEVSIDYGAEHVIPESVSFIGTQISRYVADPNRPISLEGGNSLAGGTFWTNSILNNEPIYTNKPTSDRISELTQKFYTPYLNRLSDLTKLLVNKHGSCLVIDIHSFGVHDLTKKYYSNRGIDNPSKQLPLLCLSFDSQVCSSLIQEYIKESIMKYFYELSKDDQADLLKDTNGSIFQINFPFSGGNVTKSFGNAEEGVNTMQIEFNRGALTDTIESNNYFCGKIKEKNAKNLCLILEKIVTNLPKA